MCVHICVKLKKTKKTKTKRRSHSLFHVRRLGDGIRHLSIRKRGGKGVFRSEGRIKGGTDTVGIGAVLVFSGHRSVAGREDECR